MVDNEIGISSEEHQELLHYFDIVFSKDLLYTYEKYAPKYETYMQKNHYCAYVQVAKGLKSCFGEDTSRLILDVGCGTGLLGKSLNEFGFNDLHGLDVCDKIVDKAREKKLYSKFHIGLVTTEPIKTIEKNTYDAVVSSGCFIPGHIRIDALVELARITKPGGFIVFSLNDPKYEMNYMEELGKIILTNKLELVEMKLVPYKRECTKNYVQIYAYLVIFKVL